MSRNLILQVRENNLLTVTIDRPEKANSLTKEMLLQLRDAFHNAAEDDDLRAVIITGAGGRVFCAGADLTTLYDERQSPDPWVEMSEALKSVPSLTIAAINGPCMGGGLSIALDCDIRIAVPEARFAYPVLKNNVSPRQEEMGILSSLVGHGRASIILLGGDTIPSDEAERWGLVDRVVEREALADSCRQLCATAIIADGDHLKNLKSILKGSPA